MYEEKRYKPLSPWAYFGYGLLFAIPVVGIILIIIMSFSAKNINLKNFARSFCIFLLLALIIAGAAAGLYLAGFLSFEKLKNLFSQIFLKNF